jgi:hypothetical protein
MTGFRPGWLTALLLLSLFSYGCSDSSGPNGALDAEIRFVNAINNTVGPVEIGLQGGPASELVFTGESEYTGAESSFRIAFASDQEGILRTTEIFLSSGSHYSVAFVGHADIDLVSWIFLADDPGGEPDDGRVFIRIAQGGLQTGDVDVYVLEEGETVDGSPDVPGLDWLDVTLYGDFASGDLKLVLTRVADPDSVIFESGPLAIPSGSMRTFLVYDATTGLGATTDLIVLDDDA